MMYLIIVENLKKLLGTIMFNWAYFFIAFNHFDASIGQSQSLLCCKNKKNMEDTIITMACKCLLKR